MSQESEEHWVQRGLIPLDFYKAVTAAATSTHEM